LQPERSGLLLEQTKVLQQVQARQQLEQHKLPEQELVQVLVQVLVLRPELQLQVLKLVQPEPLVRQTQIQ
jgi:hypothetical protein